MSTSDDGGYSGRLRSSTRPIQEAQGEGRERSRSRESRRGGRAENLDDDSDSNTSQQHGTPTDHPDSPFDKAENSYRARRHHDDKYPQPRGSISSCLQSTTVDS